tara:strand:+ start:3847 stop:5439 length:1593 start_codon:yes stop_codon:yes gene_type:complete
MNNYKCQVLQSDPGVQRDGTNYDSTNFIDGQWTRFYNNKPRKMGGYKAVNYGTDQIIRSMYSAPLDNDVQIYLGRIESLSYVSLPISGNININLTNEVDRTPTSLDLNPENAWSFDLFTNFTDAYLESQIIAQVCPNASSINNAVEGPIYYGSITNNLPLLPIIDSELGTIQCSGGIVFLSPILVAYGNNGKIQWTDPNAADPLNTWHDSSNNPLENTIANTKIVYGTSIIGASVPTGLFWSLNSLIRVTYSAITTADVTSYVFASTTIDNNISIISNTSVVSYKQTYFWIGTDQFYMFDGVVQTIPNTMNRHWFFNNVNFEQRNKIFGYVNSRYDEIIWYYPTRDSTENNAFIAYNYVGRFWFDSLNGRSTGVSANVLPFPLLADSQSTAITTRRGVENYYLLWQHEIGSDKDISGKLTPILSNYTHHITDICSQPDSQNRLIRNRRVEPNFSMIGNMDLWFINMMWAADYINGNAIIDGPYPFNSFTQFVDMASQGRQVALKFQSNELGGFFQGGKTLFDWEVGDVQP